MKESGNLFGKFGSDTFESTVMSQQAAEVGISIDFSEQYSAVDVWTFLRRVVIVTNQITTKPFEITGRSNTTLTSAYSHVNKLLLFNPLQYFLHPLLI